MTGKKVIIPQGTNIETCADLEGTLIDGTHPSVIVDIDGRLFLLGELIPYKQTDPTNASEEVAG